jgi:hypothetical protein
LTRGDDLISASSATYSDEEAGGTSWELSGDLRVVLRSAELIGDTGTFMFDAANELISARIFGEPVGWSDFEAESDTVYQGSAETIEIDNRATTLRLLGRTILSRRSGQREPIDYEGCDWIYNWINHSFDAGTPDCGVRMLITPLREDAATEPQSGPP